ncbi:MAG: hypothetical protein ACTSYL_09460, partial [Candidatus Thorarchaeota archaeon]
TTGLRGPLGVHAPHPAILVTQLLPHVHYGPPYSGPQVRAQRPGQASLSSGGRIVLQALEDQRPHLVFLTPPHRPDASSFSGEDR